MKRLLLLILLIFLSLSLFADPDDDAHNGKEFILPIISNDCSVNVSENVVRIHTLINFKYLKQLE